MFVRHSLLIKNALCNYILCSKLARPNIAKFLLLSIRPFHFHLRLQRQQSRAAQSTRIAGAKPAILLRDKAEEEEPSAVTLGSIMS